MYPIFHYNEGNAWHPCLFTRIFDILLTKKYRQLFLQMHHFQVDLEPSLICKYKGRNFFFKSSSFKIQKSNFCQVWRGEIVHPHKSQSSDICRKSFSNAILNVKNITLAPHSHFPSHLFYISWAILTCVVSNGRSNTSQLGRENMSEGRSCCMEKVKRNILLPERSTMRYIFSFIWHIN